MPSLHPDLLSGTHRLLSSLLRGFCSGSVILWTCVSRKASSQEARMNDQAPRNHASTGAFSRRHFLGTAASAAGLTIITRAKLGACGFPPSDRLNLGCVGVGAQGTRVMMDFLQQS